MSDTNVPLRRRREELRAELADIDAVLGEAPRDVADESIGLLDALGIGIWSITIPTWKTVFVNSALLEMTGRPREAFVDGLPILQWIHPDDQPIAADAMRRVFVEESLDSYEVSIRLVRPDGQARFCSFRAHLVRGPEGEIKHGHLLIVDVHEKKGVEKGVRTTKRRFRRILEDNGDVLWMVDNQGNISALGGSNREIGGWPVDVLLKNSPRPLVHADDIEAVENAWAMVLATPWAVVRKECRFRRLDGGYVWIETTARNLLHDPEINAVLLVTRDIDARKRESATAAVNAELVRSIQATNVQLRQALRAKDDFVANMSHELRTPLNGVLGFSEALLANIHGPLNEKQRVSLQHIDECGRHLLALIEEILDLVRTKANKIRLELAPVAILDVCEASLHIIEAEAQKKGLHVSFEASDRRATLWADELKLRQILLNMLSNAIKFTPKGGSIGLEVHTDAAENKATFCVWDQGIGIASRDLERIFEPFAQVDTSYSRAHDGMGLGLSLVQKFAELHGGSVSVQSELGKGSRFCVTLPMGERDAVSLRNGPAVIADEDVDALRRIGNARMQLTDAAALANFGYYEWSTSGVIWSPESFVIMDRDPALGQPTVEEMLAVVHPDDRQRVHQTYAAGTITRECIDTEFRIVMRDGEIRWIHGRARPVLDDNGRLDRYLGVLQDVTEHKRTVEALSRSRAMYHTMFEMANEGVCILDRDRRIVVANRRFEEIWELTAGEVVGRTIFDLTHPSWWPVARQRSAELTQHSTRVFDQEVMLRDGTRKWLRVSLHANFDEFGTFAGAEGFYTDLTATRKVQEELDAARKRFEWALGLTKTIVFDQDTNLRYVRIYNGWPGFEPLGKRDDELLPPEYARTVMQLKQRVLDTGTSAHEELVVGIGNEYLWYDLWVEPMRDEQGQIIGVACIAQDITSRKYTEG